MLFYSFDHFVIGRLFQCSIHRAAGMLLYAVCMINHKHDEYHNDNDTRHLHCKIHKRTYTHTHTIRQTHTRSYPAHLHLRIQYNSLWTSGLVCCSRLCCCYCGSNSSWWKCEHTIHQHTAILFYILSLSSSLSSSIIRYTPYKVYRL